MAGAILFLPGFIYILAAVIPSIAVGVRRFHDTGRSGWLLFWLSVLGCVPLVGLIASIVQIVFLCEDSTPGMNQYGPNPKIIDPAFAAFAGVAGFPQPVINPIQQPFSGDAHLGFCPRCGAMRRDASPLCGSCGMQILP